MSYPTVLKAVTLIRIAIVANARDAQDLLNGEIELDETYFGGKRKGKRGRGALTRFLCSVFSKEMVLLEWML